MTFTEAAVEVLRLVGRPLHYKKITEIAIAKNLLSHVGKAPDMTMSSRLATMIKKDRGEEPIVKVKPGVFALREFDDATMALADEAFDVDVGSLPDVEPKKESSEGDEAAERPKLPGAEVFPEEEDDDEPILAKIADDEGKGGSKGGGKGGSKGDSDDDGGGSGRGRRRRRKRRGRGSKDKDDDKDSRGRDSGSKDSGGRGRSRRSRGGKRKKSREPLDMDRQPEDGDPMGRELADAILSALESQPRDPVTYARAAELLVSKGRLAGSPSSLAPTVAAAVRADRLRRGTLGQRFREVDGRLALTEWYLPRSVAKLEREAREAATKQRQKVHRAFLEKLQDLPAAGFVELLATWLNAEGVGSLRAVRRPGSSGDELHLAGTLRRGQEEVNVALLVLRDGSELEAERIVEIRGALHHYGNASAAWVVTVGRVGKRAREEVEVAGAPPCVLYDGQALAEAMESRGVGLRTLALPIAAIDLSLLDALRGEPESFGDDDEDDDDGGRGKRGKSKRKRGGKGRGRGRSSDDGSDDEDDEDGSEDSDDDSGDAGSDDDEGGKRRRRGRRRSKRSDDDDSDESEGSDGSSADDDGDDERKGKGRRRRRGRGRGKKDDDGSDASEGSDEDGSDDDDREGKGRRRRRGRGSKGGGRSRSDEDGSDDGDAGESGSSGDDEAAGSEEASDPGESKRGGRRRRRGRGRQSDDSDEGPSDEGSSDDDEGGSGEGRSRRRRGRGRGRSGSGESGSGESGSGEAGGASSDDEGGGGTRRRRGRGKGSAEAGDGSGADDDSEKSGGEEPAPE
ncbi:MAG TPA: HTH domain-containing protein [Sandaracinaceae bacterium LLY-WYZ-13_1]|nr:HTH domain-containing protein [Sandaracinaceae bacterium LLY-WYZ-13_1]